jgi:hypothetical protein
MIVELLQRALDGRITARRAAELHVVAKVIPSPPANNAFFTWPLRLHDHSISNLEIGDIPPYGGNLACGFMAQDERFFYDVDSIACVLEIMHIGAADSCGTNADLDLMVSRGCGGPVFDAEILGAVEDGAFVRLC